MVETYQVKITEQAQSQIQEIIHYISSELMAPDTALHWLDCLEDAISTISKLPNRIALTEEEPWRSRGIHKMPVKNFLVYFWIDEDAYKVQITAVIYQKRDQLRQLSIIDVY